MAKRKMIEALDLDAATLSADNKSAGFAMEAGGEAANTLGIIVELVSITGGDGTSQIDIEPLACGDGARGGESAMNIYPSYSSATEASEQNVNTGAAPGSLKMIYPIQRLDNEGRQLPPFVALNLKFTGTAFSGGRVKCYLVLG